VKFTETRLKGAFLVRLEPLEDERGFFARTWCVREFGSFGLETRLVQCNISYNRRKGTLRGMHFQVPPFEEDKLVRCTRGTVHDVIVDLRRKSETFGKHIGVILSAENRFMLHIPKGFAHGFLTLEDDTEVHYQMSEFYVPESARGVAYDDPAFGIIWPLPVSLISPKDLSWNRYAA